MHFAWDFYFIVKIRQIQNGENSCVGYSYVIMSIKHNLKTNGVYIRKLVVVI